MVEAWLHISSSGMSYSVARGKSMTLIHSQHLGGIHSGCALSGTLWLILKVVDTFRNRHVSHDAILAIGVATNLAVAISALSAFPWVRNNHHKYVGLRVSLLHFLIEDFQCV